MGGERANPRRVGPKQSFNKCPQNNHAQSWRGPTVYPQIWSLACLPLQGDGASVGNQGVWAHQLHGGIVSKGAGEPSSLAGKHPGQPTASPSFPHLRAWGDGEKPRTLVLTGSFPGLPLSNLSPGVTWKEALKIVHLNKLSFPSQHAHRIAGQRQQSGPSNVSAAVALWAHKRDVTGFSSDCSSG